MMVDELFDGWQTAWSAHAPEGFAEWCVPAVQYQDPLTPEPLKGALALGAYAARLWTAFPDLRIERTGVRLSDGCFAAAPYQLTGTQREPFGGWPSSGRELHLHLLFYCELERERLLRVRGFFDAYDAARQLGFLPSGDGISARALMALRGFGLRRA